MKKFFILIIIALLFVIMLAGCASLKDPVDTSKNAINSILDKFESGMLTKNVALVVDCFTDPYLEDGVEPWTHEQLTEDFQDTFSYTTYYIYEFKNRLINVTGSEGSVLCDVHTKTASFEDTMYNFEMIFVKTSNGWKISESRYND